MASTQVTVAGTHVDAAGTAMTGTVYWTPVEAMDQSGDDKTYAGRISDTLSSGDWSVTVPANDDTDVSPTTAYIVELDLASSEGKAYKRRFRVQVSNSAASQRWEDLDKDVDTTPYVAYASQSSVTANTALVYKRTAAGARVAITGDSNAVGYNAPTSNITGRPVEQSWATQTIYSSAGRLQWAGNFAVASTTSADLDGQLDNALATDAGIVVISHGTNDLNVDSLTVAQSAANILAGIERVRAAGRVPWLFTPPPRSDAAADDHVAGLAAWERDFASRNPDVIFTDLFRALADPTTGGLASGLGVSESPVIHLTPEGARVAAKRALADIEPRLPTVSAVKLPRSKAEPGDLLAGVGVATTLTSNVPTGWTAMAGAEHTGNTTTSLVSADSWDPIPGSWYRVAKTASTALSGAFYTLSTSLWDPGEELELVGRVRISADLTGGQARVYLFGSPSGAFGWFSQPVWELNGECDWTFTIRGTIPDTVTSLLIRREVNLLSGSSEITGTVDFGPVAVWNRTTADWETIG